MHPIHRRLLAEELVRRRRADEHQRYAASQRRGRVDPNPHQVDAVVFALRRIPDGGCILADEVGLGKTIEAGLVIAQLLAEGARRILLIVPRPLLGQWQAELWTLFGIAAIEGVAEPGGFDGEGVFLIGREAAGGEKGSSLLKAADPFDLAVIDEAHELFAGIWRRYDKRGDYDDDAREARLAHRVKHALVARRTPVLLLTATPIQNSLAELWGLVQWVEPTGTLLGRLPVFRQLFCDGDDRRLAPGQAHELRRRLGTVLQRTLRRQAQEFLDVPFVERTARLVEYSMPQDERSLYDAVTSWLLRPDLCSFRGGARRLLLIGFHRRMASSLPALAASLELVARRLRKLLDPKKRDDGGAEEASANAKDLEVADPAELVLDPTRDDPDAPETAEDEEGGRVKRPPGAPSRAGIEAELAEVVEFIRRARALPTEAKARGLLEVARATAARRASGEGSGKLVVFTESLTTQEHLERLLVTEGGLRPDEVTLFRGQNEGARAREALARWETEVGAALAPGQRPSPAIAQRLALVHEFATRSRVLVATEAGAKGLNLQFCETLVNYDLPWNPQRVEQRIGRCHRYGQTRAVTVVNFLARENETERLLLEILGQKLDLFGKVLDASDVVLHVPGEGGAATQGVGLDLEARLHHIWERARTVADVQADLRALRDQVGRERAVFDEAQSRARGLIETRLDENVRQVFRRYQQEMPAGLAQLDRDLERLVTAHLEAQGARFSRREQEGRVLLEVGASADHPAGALLALGRSRPGEPGEALHLGHPIVQAAVASARAASGSPRRVRLRLPSNPPEVLRELRGRAGRVVVTKVAHRGFEPVDRLLRVGLASGTNAPLPDPVVDALLALPIEDATGAARADAPRAEQVEEAVEEAVLADQAAAAEVDRRRFERMIEQIERWVDDQALVLRRERQDLDERASKAARKRDATVAADARERAERELARLDQRRAEVEERLAKLEAREDPDYRRWREQAHERRYARPEVTRLIDVEWVLE